LQTMDLHGSDVGAATDKVARVLSAVSELPMSALKVIYGQGKNSEMGRARLGPAVREFLEGQNIKFYEAQDGGSLIVPLS
jgi:DNA-nicking Smr family endonuclease